MRPFPTVFLAVQGHGDSRDSSSCHCLPVPVLMGCQLQAWCIRPCQAGDRGGLCFPQRPVPACPRWAVPATQGFVSPPSPLHAHKKGNWKRKKGSRVGFGGFLCCSVCRRGVLWLEGLVWGQLALVEGTGLNPAPSQPGWCWGTRHLTRLNEEGWLEPAHGRLCCRLGRGAVSCKRDSSVGTAGIAREPARMGRGAMGLSRAGGPDAAVGWKLLIIFTDVF